MVCCMSSMRTHTVMRAMGVSHTACKVEFRQNLRSHCWSVIFFIIYPGIIEPLCLDSTRSMYCRCKAYYHTAVVGSWT